MMKRVLSLIFLSLFCVISYAQTLDVKDLSKDLASLNIVMTSTKTIVLPSTVDPSDSFWSDTEDDLLKNKYQDLTIRVQGYGGDSMAGYQFVRSLIDAKASGTKVHMIVTGPAYSMHAYIVCAADDYILEPGSSLMFHRAASYDTVLMGQITTKNTDTDPSQRQMQINMLEMCINKGLLTKQTAIDVINGKEVYLYADAGGKLQTEVRQDSMDVFLPSLYKTILDVLFILGLIAAIRVIFVYIRRD